MLQDPVQIRDGNKNGRLLGKRNELVSTTASLPGPAPEV